jgi:hypothetical protein
MTECERIAELEAETTALRAAITLLHHIANLSRESLELRPVCYATLTGVTAGVGLGFNRAMLFFAEPPGGDGASPRRCAASRRSGRSTAPRPTACGSPSRPRPRPAHPLRGRRPRRRRPRRPRPSPARGRRRSGRRVPRRASLPPPRRGHRERDDEDDDDLDGLLDPPTAIAAPLRGRLGVHGVLYADNRFTGPAHRRDHRPRLRHGRRPHRAGHRERPPLRGRRPRRPHRRAHRPRAPRRAHGRRLATAVLAARHTQAPRSPW